MRARERGSVWLVGASHADGVGQSMCDTIGAGRHTRTHGTQHSNTQHSRPQERHTAGENFPAACCAVGSDQCMTSLFGVASYITNMVWCDVVKVSVHRRPWASGTWQRNTPAKYELRMVAWNQRHVHSACA